MAKVRYSSLAANDLIENAEYIAQDKPEAAYRWLEKIEATCELIAANPQIGQERSTRGFGDCRSFVFGNHVIFFRSVAGLVEIVRIVHVQRDIESL